MKKTKNENLQHVKILLGLIILQYLIDTLFIYVYPSVNPLRATLIGITAFIVLSIFVSISWFSKWLGWSAKIAFLPIFSSALFGALLVNAGVLISKSALSGIVHVIILIATYVIIVLIRRR